MITDSFLREKREKHLMVCFSDGKSYHGGVDLYRGGGVEPSYINKSRTSDLMFYVDKCNHIKPKGSEFIYTTSSIIRFCDMTDDEYKSYTRDQKIKEII